MGISLTDRNARRSATALRLRTMIVSLFSLTVLFGFGAQHAEPQGRDQVKWLSRLAVPLSPVRALHPNKVLPFYSPSKQKEYVTILFG